MQLDLKLTKQNKIVLILSLVAFCLLVYPFIRTESGQSFVLIDIMQDEDYGTITLFLYAYWIALIATNFFMLTNKLDFAKIASIITLGALGLCVVLCVGEFGRLDDERFYGHNLFSGFVFSLAIAISILVIITKTMKNQPKQEKAQ